MGFNLAFKGLNSVSFCYTVLYFFHSVSLPILQIIFLT